MTIQDSNPLLNIQNQLIQDEMDMVKTVVQTQAMIESSNLGLIAPDIEQALIDQVLIPIAYAANSLGNVSLKNAPTSPIVDILA